MSTDQEHDESVSSPDIHFKPIVTLDKVETKNFEENEEEIFKMRAKLFRYIIGQHDSTPEWKERGVGDVKILKHQSKHSYRLVMRREKTLKVCANHFLNKEMELRPNCGNDRAWVWNVPADFADEEPQKETLAIRFANAESATKFKDVFDECKGKIETKTCDEEREKLASALESLEVKDETENTENTPPEKCNGQIEGKQEDEQNTEERKEDESQNPEDSKEKGDDKEGESQNPEDSKEKDVGESSDAVPDSSSKESEGQ